MSARLASAAAFTVAAAVGSTLVPLAAHAAPVASDKPLTIELGTPAPAGPLTRGGASETFTFSVKNASEKPVDFQPSLVGDTDGASPIAASHIGFDVVPVNAPATDEFVGQRGTGAQGLFHPADKGRNAPFSVPAKGELTWKVSVGLGAKFPTNNGNLKLQAGDLAESTKEKKEDTVVFETSPKVSTGRASMSLDTDEKFPIEPGTRGTVYLVHRLEGGHTFDSELASTLEVVEEPGANGRLPELFVEERNLDGTYSQVRKVAGVSRWQLSNMPKSLLHTYALRVSVMDYVGIRKPVKIRLRATSALTEGNTTPFLTDEGTITVAPARATTPSDEPSATPSATASPSPSPSESPTPSATVTETAVASTQVTTTGALADTGSSSATRYAAIAAAVLIAAGGALMALRLRRR